MIINRTGAHKQANIQRDTNPFYLRTTAKYRVPGHLPRMRAAGHATGHTAPKQFSLKRRPPSPPKRTHTLSDFRKRQEEPKYMVWRRSSLRWSGCATYFQQNSTKSSKTGQLPSYGPLKKTLQAGQSIQLKPMPSTHFETGHTQVKERSTHARPGMHMQQCPAVLSGVLIASPPSGSVFFGWPCFVSHNLWLAFYVQWTPHPSRQALAQRLALPWPDLQVTGEIGEGSLRVRRIIV